MHDNRLAMSKRKASQRIAMLKSTAAFDLPAGGDGKRTAPTEFKVFGFGPFTTTKGIFTFTQKSADEVMRAYSQRQLPLMGDYEHQTDAESMGLPPMEAPASITEMTPEIRMDGMGRPELWVKDVKWTARALAYLEAGEYRLFSPVFGHTPEGEITSLIRIALTNKPATDGLQPLVAAKDNNDEEDEEIMAIEACAACTAKDQEIGKLTAQLTALSTEKEALTAKLKDFGQRAEEEEKEHAQLTALTGKKDKAEIIAVLTAHKAQAEQFVTLKAKVDADEVARLTAEYTTTADAAIKEGKLPPALKDEWLKDGPEKGLKQLTTFLSALGGKTLVTTLTNVVKEPAANGGTLSAEQLKLARQMGKTDEWAQKHLRPLGAGTNA